MNDLAFSPACIFVPQHQRARARRSSRTTQVRSVYPRARFELPRGVYVAGDYEVLFATTEVDLRAVQRLREDVNPHAAQDRLDAYGHHVMVVHRETGELVGSCRLMTSRLARQCGRFDSAERFSFDGMPSVVVHQALEVGPSCIRLGRHQARIGHLLWHGIGRHLGWNRKRYLFGCVALKAGPDLGHRLREAGHLHPFIELAARPMPRGVGRYTLARPAHSLKTFLNLGAQVIAPPVYNGHCVELMLQLDTKRMPTSARRQYLAASRWDA